MSLIYITVIFFLAAFISYAITPAFIDIFERAGKVTKNYMGQNIPQGIGIIFSIIGLFWLCFYLSFFNTSFNHLLLFYFAVTAMSLVGFIDDMLGTRDVLGFKGHFKALAHGKITTGSLKAIAGIAIAFIATYPFSAGTLEIAVNTFLAALMTNFFNLLDLRPGRAIKFYILCCTAMWLYSAIASKVQTFIIFIPLIATISGYLPYDLKAKSMMGDAGSNVLGISLGIMAAFMLGLYIKIGILVFLILIHIYTEKYSLTEIIKKNRILNCLDNLGRHEG